MTGALTIEGDERVGRILFNEGRIVSAEMDARAGRCRLSAVVEVSGGCFEFEISTREFPVTINAASNTNLILDSLRQLDEEESG